MATRSQVFTRAGSKAIISNEILGFANDQDRLRAIQQHLDEAGLEVVLFPGYGPLVRCLE